MALTFLVGTQRKPKRKKARQTKPKKTKKRKAAKRMPERPAKTNIPVKQKPVSHVRKPHVPEKVVEGKTKEGFVVVRRPDGKIVYLETNADRLLKMVNRKGELKISEAAKSFGISESKIEEWGNILEEHKLVRMHYSPIGDPKIISLKQRKNHGKAKK